MGRSGSGRARTSLSLLHFSFFATPLRSSGLSLPSMPKTLSVVLITLNEAANLPRTLASVSWAQEIVVVDSGSTDATLEIARERRRARLRGAVEGLCRAKKLRHRPCHRRLDSLARRRRRGQPRAGPRNPGSPGRRARLQRLPHSAPQSFSGGRCATAAIGPIPSCASFAAARRDLPSARSTRRWRPPGRWASSKAISSTTATPRLTDYIEHMNRYSSIAARDARRLGPRRPFLALALRGMRC